MWGISVEGGAESPKVRDPIRKEKKKCVYMYTVLPTIGPMNYSHMGHLLQIGRIDGPTEYLSVLLAAMKFVPSCIKRYSFQFEDNCLAEMSSGSEEGLCSRLVDCCITQL